ncbi:MULTISPECIES: hypothetical protein [unclassified Streptomyces]|uniref:hypothetical protein n=1 Tax=unclassified Streptomyces TaxID=2593676 RepID=UPI0034125860
MTATTPVTVVWTVRVPSKAQSLAPTRTFRTRSRPPTAFTVCLLGSPYPIAPP